MVIALLTTRAFHHDGTGYHVDDNLFRKDKLKPVWFVNFFEMEVVRDDKTSGDKLPHYFGLCGIPSRTLCHQKSFSKTLHYFY
jgi:hypothetical protein